MKPVECQPSYIVVTNSEGGLGCYQTPFTNTDYRRVMV